MTAQSTALTTPAERKAPSYAAVDMSANGAGGSLAPKNLGDVVAFAQVMARADLALPKHLRGNDGACMAVTMQAMRWEMDPFAVANKSYSVNDRLAFEAQLVAAVVHTRAPIKGRPNYIYSGEGTTRRCQVICVMSDGEEREYTSPQFGQITTKNSPLWKSDPDQQLGYVAIRSWARRHAPEVILGVYTPDEVATIRDVTPATEPGLRSRLEARKEASTEGFNASQAQAETSHNPETGEIIDAEVEEQTGEQQDGDDRFPGDRRTDQSQPDEGQTQHQPGPSLTQRVDDFKKRLADAPNSTKAKAIWAASANLRDDIDRADADTVPMTSEEMETHFNARFAELEQAEQEAKG